MARKREEQDLFNFSFVDILATTIGVLIFIMVLTLLNSVNRASNVEIEDELKETVTYNEKIQKTIDGIRAKVSGEEKLKEEFGAAGGKTGEIESKYRKEKEREKELKEQNIKLEAELKDLAQKYADVEKEAARLKEKAVEAQINSSKLKEKVTFRIPEEKATSKQPVIFECANSKIYIMAEGNKSPRRDNYTVSQHGAFVSIVRNQNAKGNGLDAVKDPNSEIWKLLNRLDAGKYYALFIVRTDSFSIFRELRTLMWKKNWDLIWEPYLHGGNTILAPANASGGNTVL